MRLSLLLKTAVVTCITLLCVGFMATFYFELSATEKSEDFDLYTLVPSTSVAVVDTDDVVKLMQDLNELECSKDGNFLVFSYLFSNLKDHINTLLDETPHGLSKQMSKMLISFHEPNNEKNQVFYFRLGNGDLEFVNRFINKYHSADFSVKTFSYKDETIKIYPMLDDTFLACYFGAEYLAVSTEMRLIEEVIDARAEKQSLLNDSSFTEVRSFSGTSLPATIYIKENTVFNSWVEFTMKANPDAIYFSGVVGQSADSLSFSRRLCKQSPLDHFPGDMLPASTFFFTERSASDLQSLLDIVPAEASLLTCFFHPEDSLKMEVPLVVASVPVKDVIKARRSLRAMKSMPLVNMESLFAELTGIAGVEQPHADFYNGRLVLASDSVSFASYAHALKDEEVLHRKSATYEKAISSLSDSYNYLMMGDLESVLTLSGKPFLIMPEFFSRYSEFFNNFVLSAQITCNEGVIYPNVILFYKED